MLKIQSVVFLLSFLFFLGCKHGKQAKTYQEISRMLATFSKEGHRVSWRNDKLIFIQPYEGVSTNFEIFQDGNKQKWYFKTQYEFKEALWTISKVEQTNDTFTFYLQNNTSSQQKAVLYYEVYSIQRQIGRWVEKGSAHVFREQENYFVSPQKLSLFEKVFEADTASELVSSLSKTKVSPNADTQSGYWLFFKGTLGQEKHYPITSYICRNLDKTFAKGVYVYNHVWIDLELKTQNNSTFTWVLDEYSCVTPHQKTGVFSGDIDENTLYKGTWIHRNQQSRYPFSLEKTDLSYQIQDWKQQGNNQNTYFPKLLNTQKLELATFFNNELVQPILEQWRDEQLGQLYIDYHVLFANAHVISILFFAKKNHQIIDVKSINFDIRENKAVFIEDVFHVQNNFQIELLDLAQKKLTYFASKYDTDLVTISDYQNIRSYNFLRKNFRLVVFDTVQKQFITVHIPYSEIKKYIKKGVLINYQLI